VENSLRVGTIFVLENGTPGPRNAEITRLDVPFWHFGDGVKGMYNVKNTATAGEATGFFPTSIVSIDPLHRQQQVDSKLIFAGRSRETNFEVKSSRIGFYKVSAAYGDSKQEKWVFMLTGHWRAVVIIAIILLAISALFWRGTHLRKL
jgi:hypothetical protein